MKLSTTSIIFVFTTLVVFLSNFLIINTAHAKTVVLFDHKSSMQQQLLKTQKLRHKAFNTRHLSTNDLLRVAKFQRESSTDLTQSFHNYYWLANQRPQTLAQLAGSTNRRSVRPGAIEGKDAVLNSMVTIGLKSFWNDMRTKMFPYADYIPDGNGRGIITPTLDYQLQWNSKRLSLRFKHHF